MDEWVKNVIYINIYIIFRHKNKIFPFFIVNDYEGIMLSEVSEKDNK